MTWKRSKSGYPLLIIAVFAVGLLLAGGLLYRWINRASVADREQQSEFLRAAMRSFRGEFIATLLEVRATFHPMPRAGTTAALDDYLAGFYSQWRSNDANGALVSTLSVATMGADGKLQFRTLDPETGRFKAKPWPKSLQSFRPRVERITTREGGHDLIFRASVFPLAVEGDHPVVVVPLLESGGRGRGPGPWPGPRAPAELPPLAGEFAARVGPGPAGQQLQGRKILPRAIRPPFPGRIRGWCFLDLDLHYLQQQLLPRLIGQSFGKAGLSNYWVAILAGNPQKVVYGSEPGLTSASLSSPDVQALLIAGYEGHGPLLRARIWRFFRGQAQARFSVARVAPFGLNNSSGSTPVERHSQQGMSATVPGPPAPPGSARMDIFTRNQFQKANAWVLVAKNKAGSIDAVVARTRHRNLALGFGVLFLLAVSMGTLVISTHRARELARREMEFVAGVSHEFRTPLASIQSAGFNLASGVVRKASRVQEYGTLVQNESRRLTDMIEQVMSYAGIQSGGKRYELVPTQISGIIDRAVAEYGPAFRDAGWQIEKKVDASLPLVLAEAPSVESAIKNLLANAVKYAGSGKWLSVTAVPVRNGDQTEVQIGVEDHGPGIDPADLAHIFEPFYRGQRMVASTVSGTGLGLSIVKRHIEAHGGRVSVESVKGKGTRFILHLPAISEIQREAV